MIAGMLLETSNFRNLRISKNSKKFLQNDGVMLVILCGFYVDETQIFLTSNEND